MRQTISLLRAAVLGVIATSCAGQTSPAVQPAPGAQPAPATQATPGAQVPGLDLANRPAVPGITRTTLRDDARVTVTRVHFLPGASEPIHTHPNDIMIVPLQAGTVTWIVGDQTMTSLAEGAVQFVPRGVSHQLANTGPVPFEIIAVALK